MCQSADRVLNYDSVKRLQMGGADYGGPCVRYRDTWKGNTQAVLGAVAPFLPINMTRKSTSHVMIKHACRPIASQEMKPSPRHIQYSIVDKSTDHYIFQARAVFATRSEREEQLYSCNWYSSTYIDQLDGYQSLSWSWSRSRSARRGFCHLVVQA